MATCGRLGDVDEDRIGRELARPSYGSYSIVIRRGLARSALGKVNVKTPSFVSAFIFS